MHLACGPSPDRNVRLHAKDHAVPIEALVWPRYAPRPGTPQSACGPPKPEDHAVLPPPCAPLQLAGRHHPARPQADCAVIVAGAVLLAMCPALHDRAGMVSSGPRGPGRKPTTTWATRRPTWPSCCSRAHQLGAALRGDGCSLCAARNVPCSQWQGRHGLNRTTGTPSRTATWATRRLDIACAHSARPQADCAVMVAAFALLAMCPALNGRQGRHGLNRTTRVPSRPAVWATRQSTWLACCS